MKRVKAISLAAILAGAISAPAGVPAPISKEVLPMTPATARLPVEGEFQTLSGATAWLNSPPLTPEGLRGKVVLADIWTYTCINWLRTLPYIRAWAAKYKDQGLVVIGVHSPEFPFERDLENVRRSAKAMMVDYPIAVDSDMAIWRAFNNDYWPALYLIDAKGKIRYHQFGEGEYERTEKVIQQLLAEARLTGRPPHDEHGGRGRDLRHRRRPAARREVSP
jgi:thiol-disulfide isomerase/thioredoxin